MSYDGPERRSAMNPFNVPEFRKELSDLLDEKISPVSDVVARHEGEIQRAKGAVRIIGLGWGLLIAALEYFFHRH